MFEDGYLKAGTWEGVPIRIHWSSPVFVWAIGGFRYLPGLWVGMGLIIIVHEIGHAFLVRRAGATAERIEISGIGGWCEFSGESLTRRHAAVIAWGGILAQIFLLAVASPVDYLLAASAGRHMSDFLGTLIGVNIFIALLNLVPIAPLDGKLAWSLVPMTLREARTRRRRKDGAVSRATRALDLEQEGTKADGRLDPKLERQLDEIRAKAMATSHEKS